MPTTGNRGYTSVSTPLANPGAMTLYHARPNEHLALAKHLTAEVKTEEFVRGKGVVTKWEKKTKHNHWFDAIYNACAAGHYCGVRLVEEQTQPKQRLSLAEMDRRARWANAPTARELAGQTKRSMSHIQIHYGRYRREELFEAARRSRACAYLADDDHDPLALQEILLAGCPTVGVRTGASFVQTGETGVVVGRRLPAVSVRKRTRTCEL